MKPIIIFTLVLFTILACNPDSDPPPINDPVSKYFYKGTIDGKEYLIEFDKKDLLAGNINACGGPGELLSNDHFYQWCICQPNGLLPSEYKFWLCSQPIMQAQVQDIAVIKSTWPIGLHLLGKGDWQESGIGITIQRGEDTFIGSNHSNQEIEITSVNGPFENARGKMIVEIGGKIDFVGQSTNMLSMLTIEDLEFLTYITLLE